MHVLQKINHMITIEIELFNGKGRTKCQVTHVDRLQSKTGVALMFFIRNLIFYFLIAMHGHIVAPVTNSERIVVRMTTKTGTHIALRRFLQRASKPSPQSCLSILADFIPDPCFFLRVSWQINAINGEPSEIFSPDQNIL